MKLLIKGSKVLVKANRKKSFGIINDFGKESSNCSRLVISLSPTLKRIEVKKMNSKIRNYFICIDRIIELCYQEYIVKHQYESYGIRTEGRKQKAISSKSATTTLYKLIVYSSDSKEEVYFENFQCCENWKCGLGMLLSTKNNSKGEEKVGRFRRGEMLKFGINGKILTNNYFKKF